MALDKSLSEDRPKAMSEDREQMLFIQWFRRTHPDVLIFHIPNGGYRRPSEAARLKAMGVVPGIPDLFIPAWHLFIEMKKEKGGIVSNAQKECIKHLQRVSYCVIIGTGFEDARLKTIDFIRTKS